MKQAKVMMKKRIKKRRRTSNFLDEKNDQKQVKSSINEIKN